MRKQQKNKHSKQLHKKQPHNKQAAVAATLMAGGMSALMLTATPAVAETAYRDALDRCVTAPPARTTFAECVERIQAFEPEGGTPTKAPAVPAPVQASPVSSSQPAGSGLEGKVTSGADQVVPVAPESRSAVAPEVPDAPTLQRVIETKAVEQVQAVDASVERTLAGQSPDGAGPEAASVDPEPASAPAAAPANDWMSGALSRLRQCESSGNYGANTGNGYYGAYQFSARTWRSLGFEGYPHQASPEVQDEAAIALQARDGWGQWPSCSRRLDLL